MSITINKIFELSSGTPPYDYSFSSDIPCVTFDPVSGTTQDGSVEVAVTFDTENCLDSAVVTMDVVDADGCMLSETINFDNPCSDLVLNPIQYTAPYSFTATGSSPGCNSLDFNWIYDQRVFIRSSLVSSSFNSTLQLSLNPGLVTYPANTTVIVQATDCDGCVREENYVFNICTPVAQNFTMNMFCDADNFESQAQVIPNLTGCTGIVIAWDTLVVQAPGTFTYTITQTSGGGRAIKFEAPLNTTPGTYSAQYSVQTDEGVPSTTGTITLVVNQCNPTNTIFIPNQSIQRDCVAYPSVGDVIEIDIESNLVVSSGVTVDWGTWTLVTPPSSASPSITLGITGLGVHVANYEIPAPGTGSDSFKWTVCDTNMNCAAAGTITVVLDCAAPPVATDDSYCVSCGETAVLDVLTNDLGGGSLLDSQSIAIVSAPTLGNASIPGDGTILYTPFASSLGNDTFTYTVKNVQGDTSNIGTVTVEVICAGGDGATSICS